MAAEPANYTARQNNFCPPFSRVFPEPRFCANRRNYLREKIAKNTISGPASRPPNFFLPLESFFFFRRSIPSFQSLRANANTRNDMSFRGDFWSSDYSSLIGGNITGAIGYKSDDNDLGQEC